ncbi:MAG: ABC transporter ATP-binding protein [Oliverpabstia sp.]
MERGEIFGFLGPNGAGKTTTIKLLCGMLVPSSGSCRVFGIDPTKNPEKLHQISGVITEHAQMYDHLSGIENLIFYGTLFGINRSDCEKSLERLDLTDAQNRKLSAYSTGMRQHLSLARALMHSPEILFLDEPTSGLDPESAQNVNMLIQELAVDGTTKLFQSKILAGFSIGMMVSYISFAAMMLVLEIEMLFLTGNVLMPDISWLIILLFIAPAISIVAIAVTVRGSAKAQTMEEAQQRAVFLIFPILALVIGQFTGVILVNSGLLLGLGIVLAVLDVWLMKGAARKFSYEKLLK